MRSNRLPRPAALPRDVAAVEPEHDDAREGESQPPERPSQSTDARLAVIEPLVDRGAWREIVETLGPVEAAPDLPPALALIYAVASREAAAEDRPSLEDTGSIRPPRGLSSTQLAIRAMAALLGVAPDSWVALVLAKRILRQNPVAHAPQKTASGWGSLLLLALAIVVGVGFGSFLAVNGLRSLRVF